jgi:hypothetical protein
LPAVFCQALGALCFAGNSPDSMIQDPPIYLLPGSLARQLLAAAIPFPSCLLSLLLSDLSLLSMDSMDFSARIFDCNMPQEKSGLTLWKISSRA